MITQTYDINLIPNFGSVPVVVHASQYDTGRTLTFNLLNGDLVFTPASGARATINGTKPDGHGFEYIATISGSTISAQITNQMTAVAGSVRCELRIIDNTGEVGTANFILEVEKAGLADDTDVSDTELPAIITLATYQMQQAAESARQAASSANSASQDAATVHDDKVIVVDLADQAATAYQTLIDNEQAIADAADNAHAAATSAENAAASETNAGISATNAAASELAAKGSEDNAKDSENAAKVSEDNAKDSEIAAALSERNAASSETAARNAGLNAATSETNAATSASDSLNYARLSESWAVGKRNSVPVSSEDDTYENNSKFYATQAASSANTASGYADDARDIKSEIATMVGQVIFSVNFTTGNLMYTDDNPYGFQINRTTGNLEWEVITA